jgi:hypothetical protein
LKSIKVNASDEEVAAVLKHVDLNNSGHLDYSEFSKVFAPDMSTKLVQVEQKDRHMPNLQPSKDVNLDNKGKTDRYLDQMKETKKSFDPAHEPKLTVPSRFSAKPDFGSTFGNFQHGTGCAAWLNETDRFKGTSTGFMKPRQEGKK